MSKPIRMEPIQIRKNCWQLNVPPSVSPSGKRQRLRFTTKKKAELEREVILGRARRWGAEGRKIPANLAADAAQAAALLKEYHITLTQLARLYIQRRIEEERSITLRELWERYAEHIEEAARKGRPLSEKHKADVLNYGKHLVSRLGDKLIIVISRADIRDAIEAKYKTPSTFNACLRCTSASFTFAIERDFIQSSPYSGLKKKD